ncbi:putative protein DUF1640 [Aromatoleum bremense]|nr:putative protein DUF1640 [Aromatoleum bremense]
MPAPSRLSDGGAILRPMSTITFDTHKFVKQLESAGVPAAQAEAFVNAQRDILAEALDSALATKADVADLRSDLKLEAAGLRGELGTIRWMIAALIALAVANFAKQFF